MTVPRPLAEAMFRLVLGRPPAAQNPLRFDDTDALWRALTTSAEFRARPQGKRPMPWPLGQVFVSRRARLLYNPIGKNACTFLKQQMARLESLPGQEFVLPNIHVVTDRLATGLQLSDHPPAAVEEFLTAPGYLRLALLRDPRERLLSAYVEKFVLGRQVGPNIFHTRSVIDPVQRRQGLERPDYGRGITFRDFVDEIVSGPPQRLDPHWIPQARCLDGYAWTHLFAMEDIESLLRLIEARGGIALPRQQPNRTDSGRGTFRPGAAELLPADLMAGPRASLASFFDGGLTRKVESYFAEDYRLLAAARAGRPPPPDPKGDPP